MASLAENTVQHVTDLALTWPQKARAIVITNDEQYRSAADMLVGIKDLRREVDATFDPIIAAQHTAHKTACAQKRTAENPLVEAEGIIKAGLVSYDDEQRRAAEKEQRRLEAQARQDEERRRLEEAVLLESEGQHEQAAEVLAEAVSAPAPMVPIVQRSTPVVAGISRRETWTYRVTDLHSLVKFVAANPSYLNLLLPNGPALTAQARSLKAMAKFPGVQVFSESGIAAGSRR
jgi:hypothetical protein